MKKEVNSMRNAMKVAKWEIKRNMKNKSFIIGIFMTPAIFLIFMFIGGLMGSSGDDEVQETTHVYINDNIGLYEQLEAAADEYAFNWEMETTNVSEEEVEIELKDSEESAYIFLNEQAITNVLIPVYTSDDIPLSFMNQVQLLETPIKFWQAEKLGRMCQVILGRLITPIFVALYFCTLYWLPRCRLLTGFIR